MSLIKFVKSWWKGTHIPEPPVSQLALGNFEWHRTAASARVLCSFYLKNWKWLIGILVAIAIAYSRLSAPGE